MLSIEKIKFISTNGHVILCLLSKHTYKDVFDNLSKYDIRGARKLAWYFTGFHIIIKFNLPYVFRQCVKRTWVREAKKKLTFHTPPEL